MSKKGCIDITLSERRLSGRVSHSLTSVKLTRIVVWNDTLSDMKAETWDLISSKAYFQFAGSLDGVHDRERSWLKTFLGQNSQSNLVIFSASDSYTGLILAFSFQKPMPTITFESVLRLDRTL